MVSHVHGTNMGGTVPSNDVRSMDDVQYCSNVLHVDKAGMERYVDASLFSFSENVQEILTQTPHRHLPALMFEGDNGPWPGWRVHQPLNSLNLETG